MDWKEFQWGGSGIEEVVFGFILGKIPTGSIIIELGAGHVSTPALSEYYNLISVEHNEEFVGLYESHYIYAPMKDGWYDREKLVGIPKNAKLVIIDGSSREGILENLDLFGPDVNFLIHDTYREKEIKLGRDLAKKLGREVEFYSNKDYWAWI